MQTVYQDTPNGMDASSVIHRVCFGGSGVLFRVETFLFFGPQGRDKVRPCSLLIGVWGATMRSGPYLHGILPPVFLSLSGVCVKVFSDPESGSHPSATPRAPAHHTQLLRHSTPCTSACLGSEPICDCGGAHELQCEQNHRHT